MTHSWRAVWQLIKPYWVSEHKWRAWSLLAIIIALATGVVRLQVYVNDLNKNFYDALQHFDKKLIIHYAIMYLVAVTVFAAVVALQGYIFGQLTNHWRRFLTQDYVKRWLAQKAYYRMAVIGQEVDNPDQRISDDIDSLTSSTLSLFTGLYSSILQLATFAIVVWQLGGTLRFMVGSTHVAIPGYLFWGAVAYALINTIITMMIGNRLAKLNYQQQHYNANFRFGLMRLREYAEQIALYSGEPREHDRLNKTFRPVYNNYINILGVSRNLTFFTRSTDLLSTMIGILFALPKFLQSNAALGIGSIIQMAGAFSYVFDALSFIVNAYVAIAVWRAVVYRLTEFSEKISITDQQQLAMRLSNAVSKLSAKDVSIFLPNGQTLQKNLSLEIAQGDKLLITGNSGTGKSTLFRALAGIWPYAEGELTLPQGKKLFLSQKPYLPPGTLLETLTFPDEPQNYSRNTIIHYLEICDLSRLIPLLNKERSWHLELSLGEQQRCAFIRALLQKPDWLFLDEATASLDEKSEQKLYQLLDKELPNATIISIGHRQSLKELHHQVMAL